MRKLMCAVFVLFLVGMAFTVNAGELGDVTIGGQVYNVCLDFKDTILRRTGSGDQQILIYETPSGMTRAFDVSLRTKISYEAKELIEEEVPGVWFTNAAIGPGDSTYAFTVLYPKSFGREEVADGVLKWLQEWMIMNHPVAGAKHIHMLVRDVEGD